MLILKYFFRDVQNFLKKSSHHSYCQMIGISTFISAFVSFGIPTYSFADIYAELDESQKATLQNGQQVLVTQTVGRSWPKVTVYQKIEATPEESMAVMADCDRHVNFFKGILKSKVTQHIDTSTFIVDYTLHLPWPFSNENYSLKNHLSQTNNRSTYLLTWSMVRADTTQDIQGHVRFEELGTGTIMAYQNLVVPNSGFASVIKDQAIQSVKNAAKYLSKQIQNEKLREPTLLQQQIQDLRNALN